MPDPVVKNKFAIPMPMAADIAYDVMTKMEKEGKLSEASWSNDIGSGPYSFGGVDDYVRKVTHKPAPFDRVDIPGKFDPNGFTYDNQGNLKNLPMRQPAYEDPKKKAEETYVIAEDVFKHVVNYFEIHNAAYDRGDPKVVAAELRQNGFVEKAMAEAYKRMGITPPQKSVSREEELHQRASVMQNLEVPGCAVEGQSVPVAPDDKQRPR